MMQEAYDMQALFFSDPIAFLCPSSDKLEQRGG